MHKFKVESMSCMSCVHNIEDALKEKDISAVAIADLKSKILTVESKLTTESVKNIIEEAGYPAVNV